MNNYTVTATDGISTVTKVIAASSRRQAAQVAMDDAPAYAAFDDTATLTVTVTQP